jgi:myo-inositol-1(or 4)-monophosphatase
MKDYQSICQSVCAIAHKAGDFIKIEKTKISSDKIELKGLHDFVTYVDKTSEKIIVEELLKLLPESGFITEEKTVDYKLNDHIWIIDPLDGTTNYIHGLSPFAVSIALYYNNEAVIGVVYEVSNNECFYTWKDAPAFMNGTKIHVSSAKTLSDSLIATGFPYYDYSRIKPFMKTLEYFFQKSHGIRRIGSAATDLVYVACGRFEAFYEYSLNSWDVAAGAFIVKHAGGIVCDFKGGNEFIFGKEIIATNTFVHQEFLGIINSFLNS